MVVQFFTSCVAPSYYQVYSTKSENLKKSGNALQFENEYCLITYNLWGNGGNVGFTIYNKTEKNLIVNLEDSYFIMNDLANNYYKNRIYSYSSNSGTSNSNFSTNSTSILLNSLQSSSSNTASRTNASSTTNSNSIGTLSSRGYSISYNEEKTVCIPSKTAKYISEYSITNLLYRDCELVRYPINKSDIKTLNFSKETSPFRFSNIITLKVEDSNTYQKIENDFFVSEIANLPEKEMKISQYDEFCGKKSQTLSQYFKYNAPDRFFLFYTRTSSIGQIDNRK